MIKYSPVEISKGGFLFCRYSVAVMLWLAYAFKLDWMVLVVFGFLFLSFLLKVRKAPLIFIFDTIFGKLIKTSSEIVNENAIRFAHGAGSLLSFVGVVWLYLFPETGWYYVLCFAVLKSISALGFCPAGKLYECTLNGNCCVNKKSC